MSQSLPSSISQHAVTRHRPSRNTKLFMLVLVVLVLSVVVFFTRSALKNAAADIEDNYARTMTPLAQSKVSQLTIWFGGLKEQSQRFAAADPLRLFASEADISKATPEQLLILSRQSGESDDMDNAELVKITPDAREESGGTSGDVLDATALASDIPLIAPEPDETTQLGTQARLMLRQLDNFARTHSMTFATLYNTKGQAYLNYAEPIIDAEIIQDTNSADINGPALLSTATQEALQNVLQSGVVQLLPAYLSPDKKLIMDIIMPIYAPLYVDESGKKIVSVLVIGLDITQQVQLLTTIAKPNSPTFESSRILQAIDGVMEVLHDDGTPPTKLLDWIVPEKGQNLALDLRRFVPLSPDQDEQDGLFYTLALPVPGTPLYVEQDIPQQNSKTQYEAFQNTVLLAAVLFSIVAALLLVMLWWWLVGRSERAVSEELRHLYETVSRQNQIIDGVNTSIEDAIALTDEAGRFLYANLSFLRLAGETPQTISQRTTSALAFPTLGHNIQNHMQVIQKSQTAQSFMDELFVNGKRCFYQVGCSPFHDASQTMQGMVSVYRDITALIKAQETAQHMVTQTIHVFVRAIEAVDPYLCGQSQLTGFLATALARCLGLRSHDVTLQTAANLSQIGMIQLPHSLLKKSGKLTFEERAQLERHVEYARLALEGISFGHPVVEAITQMHERLDGTGYPLHLSGDDISVDARLLAVASTFCALLRPRSYREARSLDEAFTILASPKYDSYVVQALHSFLATDPGQAFLRDLSKTS